MEETPENKAPSKVITTVIEDEMKTAYIDYAMSVIVGRALPDVRDGLKPVHRRILYAMNDMGLQATKTFKKSARIVGEVLGKYHPHGDTAVYDSLVRMAQDFSLRMPLIKGQGNFGSVDGDRAAAMRYTEAKLAKVSDELLTDIEKETVDMMPNFDGSLKEPIVLPTKLPNLLVNGSSGIAVGMATNIPPHNLHEVVDGTLAVLDNPEVEILELTNIIKAPDFPTGGIIGGRSGILHAYLTGRGKMKIRSVMRMSESRGRKAIIIDDIPYQVNKANLLKQIAENVRDKKIEGISDIRDESDRKGTRVVIELKKDANEDVVQNQLLKHSRLQISTGIIFLSIVNNQPKVLNLKQMIEYFIDHRKIVIRRRTQFDLTKAEKKAHLLEGLTIALDNLDSVIALIKKSPSTQEAKAGLQTTYNLSEEQSQAILDMKLQRLTNLEREKIKTDYEETLKLIAELKSILESTEKIRDIIREELKDLKEKYPSPRLTQVIETDDENIEDEDLIPQEDQVVTITKSGYAKRVPLDTYKVQNRGGKGIIGTTMKEEDVVEHLFVANTHSYLLIITDKGQVHWLKVYKIPEASRQSKGKAIINLVNMSKGEQIASVIPVKEFFKDEYLVMATQNGIVKKTSLDAYSRPRQGGIIGITLDEGDKVVSVVRTTGKDKLLIASKKGQAVLFEEEDARPIGRTSRGVKGITLSKNDIVVGMVITKENDTILTLTENGYGKRTNISEYRLINRGGKGVRNIICSERNGSVVNVRSLKGDEEILLISKNGIMIRLSVEQISTIGRNTQGLRIMKLNKQDRLKSVAVILDEHRSV